MVHAYSTYQKKKNGCLYRLPICTIHYVPAALVCESADHRLQQTPSVLTMDMFDYLVKLCLSLPTLYAEDTTCNKLSRIPSGGLNDLHCLQMALTAHLVQIMLLAEFGEEQGKLRGDQWQQFV